MAAISPFDPVQEVGVAFLNSRGDEFGRAEVADGDFKIGFSFAHAHSRAVVVGECYAAAVFQRVEGFGILVEFQQFDFRMAFW